jgi:hypothetical protein
MRLDPTNAQELASIAEKAGSVARMGSLRCLSAAGRWTALACARSWHVAAISRRR